MTIEDIVKIIQKEGIARVKGALASLGYEVFQSIPDSVAPENNVSTGTISVCTVDGTPVTGHKITIEPVFSMSSSEFNNSTYYTNLINRSIVLYTNEEGTLSIPLIKGTVVRVYLEGSSLVREITVPNEDFSLLDPEISTSTDAFSSPVVAPKLVIKGDI